MHPADTDRSEVKLAFKQHQRPIGVYQIRNVATGKIYFGGSNNLDAIFNRHRFELSLDSHRNKELQQDWNEYGEASFSFEILQTVEQNDEVGRNYKEELRVLEQLWFDRLKPDVQL